MAQVTLIGKEMGFNMRWFSRWFSNIRNLERMISWGNTVGPYSLVLFLGSFIVAAVFGIFGVIFDIEPMMDISTFFSFVSVITLCSTSISIIAIVVATARLGKIDTILSYNVNWKRDGF